MTTRNNAIAPLSTCSDGLTLVLAVRDRNPCCMSVHTLWHVLALGQNHSTSRPSQTACARLSMAIVGILSDRRACILVPITGPGISASQNADHTEGMSNVTSGDRNFGSSVHGQTRVQVVVTMLGPPAGRSRTQYVARAKGGIWQHAGRRGGLSCTLRVYCYHDDVKKSVWQQASVEDFNGCNVRAHTRYQVQFRITESSH